MPLSQKIEIVTIVGQNGQPLRINKDQYDAGKHKLVGEKKQKPAPTPTPTPAPVAEPVSASKPSFGVKKWRGRFYVADESNTKVSGDVEGLDTKDGYETEQAAWDAILALA